MTPHRWCQTVSLQGFHFDTVEDMIEYQSDITKAEPVQRKAPASLDVGGHTGKQCVHSAYVSSKMLKTYTSITSRSSRECGITKLQWFYQTAPAFKYHTEICLLDLLSTIKKISQFLKGTCWYHSANWCLWFNDLPRNPLNLHRPQQFWMIELSMMTTDGPGFCTMFY